MVSSSASVFGAAPWLVGPFAGLNCQRRGVVWASESCDQCAASQNCQLVHLVLSRYLAGHSRSIYWPVSSVHTWKNYKAVLRTGAVLIFFIIADPDTFISDGIDDGELWWAMMDDLDRMWWKAVIKVIKGLLWKARMGGATMEGMTGTYDGKIWSETTVGYHDIVQQWGYHRRTVKYVRAIINDWSRKLWHWIMI